MFAPDVAQKSLGALHSVSETHGRHVCEVLLQIGVGPAQSALVVHAISHEWNWNRQTPGWTGVTFDVVRRLRTAAVRDPGNCE